jgi:LysR family transcriptional regulator, glycine cleavage system transcriptional activator
MLPRLPQLNALKAFEAAARHVSFTRAAEELCVTQGAVSASMLIDAAADGQGVALARTTLAAWDLIHGRLVRPFPIAVPLSKSYWIVCPKASANLPKLVAFRDWLVAQASQDARQLETLTASAGRLRSTRKREKAG